MPAPICGRPPSFLQPFIRSDLRGLCAVHLPRARVAHDALHRPPGPRVAPPSQPPLARRQRRFALLGTPPSGSSYLRTGPSICTARPRILYDVVVPLQCVASRGSGFCRGSTRARTLVRASFRVVPPPATMGLVTSLRSVATASLFPWYPSTAAVASTAPSADSAMTASLFSWYPSTAAVASTAPSADSAMTAYSAFDWLQRLRSFLRFHVVISHRHLPPRTRPLHGRVRPAADGRAGPFRYERKKRNCLKITLGQPASPTACNGR